MGRLRVAASGEVGGASPISPPLVAPADRWSKYFSELTFSGSLTLVYNAFVLDIMFYLWRIKPPLKLDISPKYSMINIAGGSFSKTAK